MTADNTQRLVLASGNAGKLKELRELLGDRGIELIAQGALGVGDAEETGLTFVENAILKARYARARPACLRWLTIRDCA